MLSTILGSVLGFAGSAVGPIVGIFEKKQEAKMEAQRLEHASKMAEQGFDQEKVMYILKAGDQEHARLIQHDQTISQGTGLISALQRSVRPVITYAFFGLFAFVEISLATAMIDAGMDVVEVAKAVWDDESQAIFAAVISFWFGNRAIEKRRAYVQAKQEKPE